MNKVQLNKRRSQISPSHVSSTLTLAELSFQRGDYAQARDLLQHRLGLGNDDFRTRNLLGICHANLGQFEQAEALFNQLRTQIRARPQRDKAVFNLGLLQLYQDLARYGDLSVVNTLEAAPNIMPSVPSHSKPFESSIHTLRTLIRRQSPYKDHTYTFLCFAYLQYGDLDQSLECIIQALTINENFFLSQYVLGRLFLDLFLLANEGNEFLLPKSVAAFFEVEEYEITRTQLGRLAVQPYTFLDIALQAFLTSRSLAPTAVIILNYLFQTYLLAEMFEEASETLSLAESLAPDWLSTLNLSLKYQESVQAPQEIIRILIRRIEIARRHDPHKRIFEILPPHYLL